MIWSARNRLLTAAAGATLFCLPLFVSAQDEARGAVLFDLCAQCHGPSGEGNRFFLAPAIAGMDEWYVAGQLNKFRDGLRGRHFDDISGMRMRPMAMTLVDDGDLEIVARYVANLPRANPSPELEGGDAARGAAFYATCSACHGAAGEGMPTLFGPPLAHQSDWYMLSQLQKFRAGVRGSDPKDPIAIMMRPMAIALPDEQAMRDVIAYIATLSK
jgi:cytochrome c553